MKIYDAKLCAECDEVVDMGADACPSCTCTTFFHLTTLIQPKMLRAEIDLVRTINALSATGGE